MHAIRGAAAQGGGGTVHIVPTTAMRLCDTSTGPISISERSLDPN